MTTETHVDVDIAPFEVPDAGRRSHIVRPVDNGVEDGKKGEGVTARDVIDMARLSGAEVIAICGVRFVPNRDPKKHPACEDCIRIAGEINRGERW